MTIKFTILGCGSSLGVPKIDGTYGKCNPRIKKNYRTRCSALLTIDNTNILIDTSPDIKSQLIKNNVKDIEKVFFTHMHGDQTHGINELRWFYIKSKKKINIYADPQTSNYLKKTFNYCFNSTLGYPAIMKLNKLKNEYSFTYNKQKVLIETIQVKHGKVKSILYKINNKCAYSSDVSQIYKKDFNKLKNLKYLIIDCLRYDYHPSHFNLTDVLDIVDKLNPQKTILTNLHSDIDYVKIKKMLPKSIIPAYDNLKIFL